MCMRNHHSSVLMHHSSLALIGRAPSVSDDRERVCEHSPPEPRRHDGRRLQQFADTSATDLQVRRSRLVQRRLLEHREEHRTREEGCANQSTVTREIVYAVLSPILLINISTFVHFYYANEHLFNSPLIERV